MPKISQLRKAWDDYLRQTRFTQKDIAARGRIKDSHLSKAIRDGVAPESLRQGLRRAGIPAHLIPLPNNSRVLAAMIYEHQAQA